MINKLNHFLTVSVTPSHLTEVVVERFSNRQWISNYTLVINQRNLRLLLLFPLFGSRDLKLFQNSPWCLVFVDASMQNAFNPFRFKDVTLFICFLNSSQEVFVGFFACFLTIDYDAKFRVEFVELCRATDHLWPVFFLHLQIILFGILQRWEHRHAVNWRIFYLHKGKV